MTNIYTHIGEEKAKLPLPSPKNILFIGTERSKIPPPEKGRG